MADVLCQGSFSENTTHMIRRRSISQLTWLEQRSTGKTHETEPGLSFQQHLQKPQYRIRPLIKHLLLTESGNYWLLNAPHLSQCSPSGARQWHLCYNCLRETKLPSSVLTSTNGKSGFQNSVFYYCLLNIKFQAELQGQENLCNV